jgi:hypothetical protein
MRRCSLVALLSALVLVGCGSDPGAGMTTPLDAAEAARDLAQARSRTVLPPGAAWWPVDIDPAGHYGPGFGVSAAEGQAVCEWLEVAVEADGGADAQSLAGAMRVIDDIPSWRSVTDPELADPSYRDLIRGIVRDLDGGDPGSARDFIAANCRPVPT